MVANACNPGTQKVEAAGSFRAQGHPGLHGELKASLNYIVGKKKWDLGEETHRMRGKPLQSTAW